MLAVRLARMWSIWATICAKGEGPSGTGDLVSDEVILGVAGDASSAVRAAALNPVPPR
jgi:hypothetical protein